jgi:hypothetical protein
MQRVCDELSAGKIDRLLRKWLKRLPHPFPPRDRAVGYRYDLSILQAEFSLTHVLDQPVLPVISARLIPSRTRVSTKWARWSHAGNAPPPARDLAQ